MTTLALIRHGETEWNNRGLMQGITDIPLNDTGLAQASNAAELLRSQNVVGSWSAVVTSPLVRAAATGKVIADALEIPLLDAMPQLIERDFGSLEGAEVTRVDELYPTGNFPDAESNEIVFDRALRAINDLRDTHAERSLVVVAHGGLLNTLLSRLHGTQLPWLSNAAMNLVEHDGDRWNVRIVNGEAI